MSQTGRPGLIVVGVDGSSEATEAARYAAHAAEKRGMRLLLVHAYQLTGPGSPSSAKEFDEPRDATHRLLADVLSKIVIPASLSVETLEAVATADALLREAARGASVVVIGAHHFNLVDQLLAGPTGASAAATLPCPVVVVPRRWSRLKTGRRPVIVALDGDTAAYGALRLAFDEAEMHQVRLLALHASPLDLLPIDSEEQANLEELIAGQRQDHPDVDVSTVLLPGDPAQAIIDASAGARLVVVGRPREVHRSRMWNRSVANAVLAHCRSPLMIVPPDLTPDSALFAPELANHN